jgi:hypothetical protein
MQSRRATRRGEDCHLRTVAERDLLMYAEESRNATRRGEDCHVLHELEALTT